jgi:hypothetical protein
LITAAEWYDPNPDLENFYQGDVIKDVPFFIFPTYSEKSKEGKWPVLRPRYLKPGKTLEEAMKQMPVDLVAKPAKDITNPAPWTHPLGEYVMAVARRTTVMIVTRSCAVDKPSTKHYLVAPVVSVGDLPEPARTPEKLEYLRNNEVFEWFYLPPRDGFAESFADLGQMLPVHWSFLGEKPTPAGLIARLSSQGTACLQALLSDFYGTIFGFSHEDKCPQTATYVCSKCFYTGQTEITRKIIIASEIFGECPKCGKAVTWVKIPQINNN